VLEVNDMLAINNAKFELVGTKKYTVLFIPGIFASITTEARAFSASREMNHNAIAKAILVTSTTDRLIGNFFIKINRPPAPTALFNTESEAMLWLNEMSVKAGTIPIKA
ncbi:MAG TPA: hypothetical protein VFJ43_02430, partial [Bacteroidia bacterium]|nr:hypothetical protein [Bacteroidia bacterium]